MNSLEKIKSLSIWSKEIEIKPLEGGITNLNYLVNHGSEKLVVRLGSDIPEHLVYRSNEIIVSKAAYEIGVSPKLIHSEQGVLVLEFIESTTLDPKGVQQNLKRIIPIIKKIHHEIPNTLSGQPAIFWVFYVIKYYANFLKKNKSNHIGILENLLDKSAKLEKLSLSSPREIVKLGINQVIMLSFNMVIIASMIGAGGLGYDVLTSLRKLDIGGGVEAGLAIIILAIVLDRMSYAYIGKHKKYSEKNTTFFKRNLHLIIIFVLILSYYLLGVFVEFLKSYPEHLVITIFWQQTF